MVYFRGIELSKENGKKKYSVACSCDCCRGGKELHFVSSDVELKELVIKLKGEGWEFHRINEYYVVCDKCRNFFHEDSIKRNVVISAMDCILNSDGTENNYDKSDTRIYKFAFIQSLIIIGLGAYILYMQI